jgi:hypothetical protein
MYVAKNSSRPPRFPQRVSIVVALPVRNQTQELNLLPPGLYHFGCVAAVSTATGRKARRKESTRSTLMRTRADTLVRFLQVIMLCTNLLQCAKYDSSCSSQRALISNNHHQMKVCADHGIEAKNGTMQPRTRVQMIRSLKVGP